MGSSWDTPSPTRVACEPSKTWSDLANTCARGHGARVNFDGLDMFVDAIYRLSPQGVSAISSCRYGPPGKGPLACVFNKKGNIFTFCLFLAKELSLSFSTGFPKVISVSDPEHNCKPCGGLTTASPSLGSTFSQPAMTFLQ